MPTKLFPAQANLRAVSTLARWLPHAPAAVHARAAGIVAQITDALPGLQLSLALEQQGAWLLCGVADQRAQAWLSQLAGGPDAAATCDTGRGRKSAVPARSAAVLATNDLRVELAVWNKRFGTTAFDALAAQVTLAFAAHPTAEQIQQDDLSQRRASVLNEVLEVGHLLRADRPLADMLTDIAHGIVNSLGFRSVIINVRHPVDTAVFEPTAFAGVFSEEVARLREEPLSAALLDQLCAEQWRISSSFYVPGTHSAAIFGSDLGRLTGTPALDQWPSNEWQAEDMLITPLTKPTGDLVGFISVGDPIDRRCPHRGCAEAIEIFANQATSAIENVRLYNESQRRLAEQNALNRIQQSIIASLDIRDMLRAVYAGLESALPIDSYYSLIYDQDNPDLGVAVGVDEGEWSIEQISGLHQYRGLHAYLMHLRQPLCFNDLRVEREHLPPEFQVVAFGDNTKRSASWMGVPLIAQDHELIGAISVHSYTPHRFGANDLAFLQAVTHQVAINFQNTRLFIEKARLLHEREREINQMHTLNNIGKVASSTLDLPTLFRDVYDELSCYRTIDTLHLSLCEPATSTLLQKLIIDGGQMHRLDQPCPIAPRSCTDLVMRSGAPLLLPAVHEPAQTDTALVEPDEGGTAAVSSVWVPLLNTSGQPFGVLSMQSGLAGKYDRRDIDFLANVAHQIALNIQNAALFRQSQEQVNQLAAETERLALVNRVSGWAGELLEVHELLQRTVNEMGSVTRADQVRLLLLDRARGVGICEAELHNTGAVGRLVVPLAGNPAIEWFDQHRSSLLIPDAVRDPRFGAVHHVWQAENIRDVLIVPLIVKGEVIGSIGLDAKARKQTFTERDIAICETIANQVAIAIENARLWQATQQSVQELTMLYDLSISLTTKLDLDEILATLAQAALEVERADLGAIALLNTQGQVGQFAGRTRSGVLIDAGMFNASIDFHQLRLDPKLLVLADADAGSMWECAPLDAPMRSGVMVPLLVKGQLIGALIVAAQQPRCWTEREQSLLSILAGQAAPVIENAHLFASEQDKRRLADTLREVALALTSTLDLREVLEMILLHLRRVVPYDSTSVQLLRDDDQLHIISGREMDDVLSFDDLAFPAYSPAHPNHWVLETQRPYIVHDTFVEYPAFHLTPVSQPIRSWLGVPLVYGKQVLGMITLDSRQPHFYTSEMADVALMFATQAAQAIAQARLFDQIRQFNAELEQMVDERTVALTAEKERLEAVHAITTTLTASLDIDEIVLKTLELAARAIGVNRGSLLIRDPMRDQLFYRAVLSETEGLIATSVPVNLPPGNLVQWTIEHQQGVLITDVRNDRRWVMTGGAAEGIRSFMAVPLLAADVPLGVLMLNSRQPGFFNEDHLRLLTTIGSEVAIAVHNAELYNYINEQATRLAELLQVQREETGKNRAILESVAEGVLVLDEHDTVVLFNRAASQVLQMAEDAVVGFELRRMAHYGTAAEQKRALPLYGALAEGVRVARQQPEPVNRLLELPGQTIDLTFTPVTTPDGDRVGVAAVLRDITREIESDKVKREFISTVSHELRTPLTSVKGYIDLLLLGTAGPVNDMQKSFLQVVKANADRLNGLVEDLLEISRLENGKVALNVKPIYMPDIINDIVTSLRTETERKRMELVLEIEPTLPVIEADRKRISQVFTNLLSNAHKYTRDGGRITVRAFRCDGQIQVDVVDTGVGIPPHELSKMFSRFFRANNALKDEVGGTGLGLSIAKSFVELHGGDLWVTSELHVGSTFSFTLPIEYRNPLDEPADPVLVGNVG